VHGQINCKIVEAQRCPTQKYWKIWQAKCWNLRNLNEGKKEKHIHTDIRTYYTYITYTYHMSASLRVQRGVCLGALLTLTSELNGAPQMAATLSHSLDNSSPFKWCANPIIINSVTGRGLLLFLLLPRLLFLVPRSTFLVLVQLKLQSAL